VSQENEDYAYGCVFTLTGKEDFVARDLKQHCPEIEAMSMKREKHMSRNGVKSVVLERMLPGYVFFRAPNRADYITGFSMLNIIKILRTGEGDWRLYGPDRRFAEQIFGYGGVLRFSKAYREGDKVRIIEGPLKDFEASISRIDKHGRSGEVTINFNGRELRVWLGFDLLEPPPLSS